MNVEVFDKRKCQLGEGPLWHPERKQLFWFDILNNKLLSRSGNKPLEWTFDEPVSAAGWVDDDTLLVASAKGLWRFKISNGSRTLVSALEEKNETTRSNDGRADPWGGFWIGTMGYNAEAGAGAIYRYFQGELHKLFSDISISNAICFAPDRSHAYFADTPTRKVMKVALDEFGWPNGMPEVFVDLTEEALNPDGAVVDANGWLWVAQWGASRVAAYDASGNFRQAVDLPAEQVTCPAFGGEDMDTLYMTSACVGLKYKIFGHGRHHGQTFAVKGLAKGRPEPKVNL